jgi:hypothetical protein
MEPDTKVVFDSLKGRPGLERTVQLSYQNVSEVSLDRATRQLKLVSGGELVLVDGVDRLYVRSQAWSEADGAAHLARGRVSVSGNIASAVD